MSTDIQFILSFVSALDICLTSFGDARTTSSLFSVLSVHLTFASRVSGTLEPIADQADYSPLNPARAARVDFVSPRLASRSG
ncbi:hypothetical protein L3X38_043303 [Prunus dulcis]|uniref:Uncharacterized protein n=1 Tax=Prunus dulcis TaxID=3755 RepID=A0AAD4UY75_PRUDU|nr:hypothetical protein L3X38_043303 [Prunus dulcis]